MTITEFLTKVNYALRATDDTAPAVGIAEATYWIDTFNRKKNELYEDVTKRWAITFKTTAPNEPGTGATTATTTLTGTSTNFLDYRVGDKITVSGETVRTIATITSDTVLTVSVAFSNTAPAKTFTHTSVIATGVQSYSLHRSILGLSDELSITDTNSKITYISPVQPAERDVQVQKFYVSGGNPQILTFTGTIASTDSLVGSSISVPGYYMPDDISLATDVLPLPDAYWGVMSVAAEVAGSDIIYEDKEANLNAKANNLLKMMSRKNKRGTFGNPRVTPTRAYRIRNTEVN